jgi:small subunit ribosomal protein YMR-31
LPNSFASYRSNAQQHGPLGGKFPHPLPSSSSSAPSSPPPPSPSGVTYPYGAIGGHSGAELGSIQPKKGEFFDRSELPTRFHKTPWTNTEIDAIETGGASLLG